MPILRRCILAAACAGLSAPAAAFAQTSASFERTLARGPVVESPRDVAFAPDGTAYVADDRRNALIRVAPDGAAAVLVAESETFSQPHGVTIDGAGRIVVAVRGRAALARFGRDGQRQDAFAGMVGGEAIRPIDVAVLADGLVVVEQQRILRFRGSGEDPLSDGSRWSVVAAGFGSLTAVTAVDAARVAVTDSLDRKLKLVRLDGGTIADSAGGDGSGPDEFRQPDGLSLRENGDLLVADTLNDRIKVFPAQAGRDLLAEPYVLNAAGMARPGCVVPVPGGDAERFVTCTGVIDYPSYTGERRVDLFSFGARPAQAQTPAPAGGPSPAPASTPSPAPAGGARPGAPAAGGPLAALQRRGWRCARRGTVAVCRRRPNATLRVVTAPGTRVLVRERRVVRRAVADPRGVAVIGSPRRFAAAAVRDVSVRAGGRTVRARLR
jgi:hypothetical protein